MSACVLVQRDLVPQEGRQARDEAPVYVPSGARGVIAMRVDVHGSEQAAPAEIELQPLQQEPRALGGLLQNERHHCACANAALCLIQQSFLFFRLLPPALLRCTKTSAAGRAAGTCDSTRDGPAASVQYRCAGGALVLATPTARGIAMIGVVR